MSSFAREERARLADLLEALGPDRPTLCQDWSTRDLAAHLVIRETRPDAAVGIVVKPLAPYRDKIHRDVASQPWPELVRRLRTGPPSWSPFSFPAVEKAANTIELFVHHEDVRRAQDGWAPRELEVAVEDLLWSQLRTAAPVLYRRSPVGVMLCRPDGGEARARTVRDRGTVTVTGMPSELVLHAFGRGTHARAGYGGDAGDVEALRTAPLGV